MARTKSGQTWYGPDQIRSNSARWPKGLVKTAFFRVLVSFSSLFLLFHQKYVYEMPFLQKKSVHLAFSSCRSANCNCPPRIGGHHFLLCQHTNTEDIAGPGAEKTKTYKNFPGEKHVSLVWDNSRQMSANEFSAQAFVSSCMQWST